MKDNSCTDATIASNDETEAQTAPALYKTSSPEIEKIISLDKRFRDEVKRGTADYLTYLRLSSVCRILGKLDESIAFLDKSIGLKSDFYLTHYRRGAALDQQGNLAEAINSYRRTLELNKGFPKGYASLGKALAKRANYKAAIKCFENAIKLDSSLCAAYIGLGNALKNIDVIDEAIYNYQKALDLEPLNPVIHYNLGNSFSLQGNYQEAAKSFKKALEIKPDFKQAHNNLGNTYKREGDLESATSCYYEALKVDGNMADAHANLSHCLLARYNYTDGLREYEWRDKRERPAKPHAQPNCERLKYIEDLKNKELLLVSEQGLGDTLQFIRYAKYIKSLGFKVSVCAQKKLHGLIRSSSITEHVLTPEEGEKVKSGFWIPLLSVPKLLGVTPEYCLIHPPYLKTREELIEKWRIALSTEKRPVIGINWQGNPRTEKLGLPGRSIPLDAFCKIASPANARLLSLQKGFGSEQLSACSFNQCFVKCQDKINEIWDFLETAAIIENCDLIITSDTSTAHLAGAMGKSTWLLLHRVPDWRWGLDREETFWYPSMRIFRQQEAGNWNEVLDRVCVALKKHFIIL